MKTTFFRFSSLMLLSALVIFAGCSKSSPSGSNNNNNNSGTHSDLVSSFTNVNSSTGASTTYSFTYDNQNRETGETITDGSSPISYSYGTGTVTKTQGTTTTVYTLNSAGEAASDNQGDTFTYDGSGFLTSETNPDGASTTNTVTSGNITSTVQQPSGGAATSYTFTFTGQANTIKFGLDFLGTPNTNLIQTEGINGVSYSFAYTYDKYGRVQTLKIVSGPTTLSRTYTYIN
jgi:YD repeat-containing protein